MGKPEVVKEVPQRWNDWHETGKKKFIGKNKIYAKWLDI